MKKEKKSAKITQSKPRRKRLTLKSILPLLEEGSSIDAIARKFNTRPKQVAIFLAKEYFKDELSLEDLDRASILALRLAVNEMEPPEPFDEEFITEKDLSSLVEFKNQLDRFVIDVGRMTLDRIQLENRINELQGQLTMIQQKINENESEFRKLQQQFRAASELVQAKYSLQDQAVISLEDGRISLDGEIEKEETTE